jgi:hypothetical protein
MKTRRPDAESGFGDQPIEGWRALKVLAVEKEATLNALALEAFNDLLKKHGKRQLVENPLLD